MYSSIPRHPYDSKITKKLGRYSRTELIDLKERNAQMLSNPSVVSTLPDQGAKLRETNQVIDGLLLKVFDEITIDNTNDKDCPLSKKLQSMSMMTPRQGARKRSVDLANHQAFSHYMSTGLLRKKRPSLHTHSASATTTTTTCPSMFFSQHGYQNNDTNSISQHSSKVRMLTLDESMSLQTEQQSSVKQCEKSFDYAHPSRGLLKSLNLSVDLIQQDININDVEFPHYTEEEEEEDEEEVDRMMID